MPPKKRQRTAEPGADAEAKAQTEKSAEKEKKQEEAKGTVDDKAAATNGSSMDAASGSSAAEVHKGAVLRCTELACLFNSIEDEEYEREVTPGQTLVVAGASQNCGDYTMVPVHPPNSTADAVVQWVQLDLFEVITAGKPEEAATASSAQPAAASTTAEADEEKRAALEAEQKRQDEEKRRKEEEEEKRRQNEADEKRRKEEEVEEKRRQEEEEQKRRQLEAEQKRKKEEEAEEKKKHEEAEKMRLEAEAEKRRQEDEQQKKKEAEAEKNRQEAEKKRQDEEAEKRRLEEEAEQQKKQEEAERRKKEEEEVEKRKRDEEAEDKKKQEEEADQKKEQEEAEKRRNDEDTEKQGHEDEAEKRRQEEESNRKQDEDAKKRMEEAEAEKIMQDALLKTRQEAEPENDDKPETEPTKKEEEQEKEIVSEMEPEKPEEEAAPEDAVGDDAIRELEAAEAEADAMAAAQELKRKREDMEGAAQKAEDASASEPAPGKRVKLHSLVSAADLNGQLGILTELNLQNGRWECQLLSNPDRKVQIKTDKFVILPDEAERERSRSRDRVPEEGPSAEDAFDPEAPPTQADAAAGASGAPASDSGTAPEVCTACGSSLSPDALFCRKCGTKCVGRAPASEEMPESAPGEEHGAEDGNDRPPGDNRPPPEQISDNHYEALCLTYRATESEIKKAYHVQSRKHHPDKNPGDMNATRRFQRIMEAYNVLTDRAKRAEYDGGLILQEVLGEQRYDQRTHQWVVRNRAAGRDVQSMRLEAQSCQRLIAANHAQHGMYFRNIMQATGCDLLVLDRMSPCVILLGVLASQPQDGQRAKGVIEGLLAEIEGTKAPRDGVVMILANPDNSCYMRMQQASQLFQHLYMNLRVHCRVATANRIVVQGGHSVPQAVVQIQSPLGWMASIILPNGQQLDAWTWAHHCEFTGSATAANGRPGDQFKYLCPPQDPTDPGLVRRLFCVALGMNEEDAKEESLVELSIRVLENHAKGRRITCAMMRACTSVPVHAEHVGLPSQARLPLLFALIDVIPVAGAAIADRFQRTAEFRALQALLEMFRHSSDSITLRVRCWNELRKVVPEDGEWHAWEEVLKPEGPLLDFWKDLARWMDDDRHPPIEWFQLVKIMYPILGSCIPRPAECDRKEGIRRPKAEEGAEAAEKEAQSQSKQAAVAALEGDEAEKQTLLEHIEEVLASLASTDKAFSPKTAWIPMSQVVEEAKKIEMEEEEGDIAEKITTDWFDSHKSSFEAAKVQAKGSDEFEWKIRLVPAAHIRASARLYERQCGPLREHELIIAEEVLPKLSTDKDSLPRALRPFELAALLCLLSRNQQLVASGQFPLDSLLRRFSRLPAKDLLHQIYPFSPAMVMRAVVTLAKKKTSWNKEALDVFLQAAALNMHVVEKRLSDNPMDRPPATLAQAATALWAAAQHPFSERVNEHLRRGEHNRTPIVQSASLRLQLEVSQQASMSPEGSAFRHFAQMCAWLAHVTVISSLSSEMKVDVLTAFKRLGEVCEQLGERVEAAPCDPEGLCRLSMAVALVGREEQGRKQEASGSTRRALEGIARVVVEKAMDEAFDWRPQQLAVLASAYSAAEVPHEGLFEKISEAAERHAMLGNEWSTDQLMKLLHSAQELGLLKTMLPLLRSVDVHQYVAEATPKTLPLLFNVIVSLENMDLLQELMESKKTLISQLPMQGVLAMLKSWPAQDARNPALTSIRQALVRECITLATRKAPSPSELQSIVDSIKDDPTTNTATQRLAELASAPALLASLPSSESISWSDLQKSINGILGPFVQSSVESPRLEAACAARVLQLLEKTSADSRQDARDFAPAILELPESALLGMPVVVETVADRLRAKLPRGGAASNSSYNVVRDLFQRLTAVVLKYPRRTSGDNQLDEWVERFERTVLDDTRSLRLESIEHLFSKRMPGSIRDALGPSFIATLLVRSRKLAWNGGRSLQADPPQPRNAVKKLADAGAHIDSTARERLIGLEIENAQANRAPTRAPGARDRSRSRGGHNRDPGRGGINPTAPSRFSQVPPLPERLSQLQSAQAASRLGDGERRPLYGSTLARAGSIPTSSAGGASASRPNPNYGDPPGLSAGSAYGNRYGAQIQPSSRDQPPRSEQAGNASLFRAHPDADLIVKGCMDKAMAETLQGAYKKWGMNQSRPVFQRVRDNDRNEQLVLLYFWDDRDGPDQMGWWFGPEVGGEEVWAHRGGNCLTGRDVVPPETGWRMLHNQTEDPDMRVISKSRSHPPSVAPTAKTAMATMAPRRIAPLQPVGGPPRPAPRGSAGYGGMQATPPARPPPSAAYQQQQAAPPHRPGMPSQQARQQYGNSGDRWGAQPTAQANNNAQQRRESELKNWLRKLDNGQGQLLQYYDVLAREFDADLSMIAAVKVEGGERRNGLVGCVDPSFWETVKVSKMGHRMLFAKGISQL